MNGAPAVWVGFYVWASRPRKPRSNAVTEVDVLGHEDIGRDTEALLFAGLFEDSLGGVFGGIGLEEGLATVTAEGDEVEVSGLEVTLEALWHGCASSLHPTLRKSAKDGPPELLWVGESGRVGHPPPGDSGAARA
jgi:hypothetical protein